MIRLIFVALSALALFSMNSAMAVKPPISLPKMGAWEVNYDVDSCHLFGKFGKGDQEVVIKLTREQPGSWFTLTLIGKPLSSFDTKADLTMTFGDQPHSIKRSALVGNLSTVPRLPLQIVDGLRLDGLDFSKGLGSKLPQVTPQVEAAVRSMMFKISTGKTYRLETGSMAPPMKALRGCTTDLVKSWGYDPVVQETLSKAVRPLTAPGNWISDHDFPLLAKLKRASGLVAFRLDVDEAGKVAGCRILYRTNPDEFADLTCRIFSRRAHFAPALDASGVPAS